MEYLRFFDGPVELYSLGKESVLVSACCYIDKCKVTIDFDVPRILAVEAYLLKEDKLESFINGCWEHFKSDIARCISSEVIIEQKQFSTFKRMLTHSLFMLRPMITEQLL